MLFSVADDPLAALRWSLLQVRRALTGLAEVSEEQGRLSIGFTARVEVDVPRVLAWAASTLAHAPNAHPTGDG